MLKKSMGENWNFFEDTSSLNECVLKQEICIMYGF